MVTPQNQRRKYAKNNHEQFIFTLVILLAATIYVNWPKLHFLTHIFIKVMAIVIVLILLTIFTALWRKAKRRSFTDHVSRSFIDTMSGVEFERYVAKLLPGQGYKHIHLTEYYDHGLDIIATKDNILWGIQVKRYSGPVKMSAIQQVVAALNHYGCNRAMVITNSSFSSQARDLAVSNDCLLIDGQQLIHWAIS